MEEITLKSRTTPIANTIYLVVGAVSGCATSYLISRNSSVALLPAMIAVSTVLAWHSKQGQKQLGVDRYGITIRASRSNVTLVPWSEIEEIAVTDVIAVMPRGYDSYYGQYLGVRLTASSNIRTCELCSENRRVCEYDILLPDSYGMSLEEMEALLHKAQRTARGKS